MNRGAAIILLAALVALPGSAAAREAPPTAPEEVLVLPFANYSGRYDAFAEVLPPFYESLAATGLRVLRSDELRPLLREHRIRVVGQAGGRAMDALRADTGARLAIVGSIDVYEPDRALEVLLSVRLLDLADHSVLTAMSVGRTVQETERVFGRGRASEIREVVDDVVAELEGGLAPLLAGERPGAGHHKCGLVAVVPLEDYSDRRHGAEVLQNLLMAELVARGWQVVEPGVVHEALLDEQEMARGGISRRIQGVLHDRLGACIAVTGELEEFSLAPSPMASAVPRIGYGLRLIDLTRQRLVDSIDITRDGMDGGTLFGMGIEYSMARLVRESMSDVVDWIASRGDQ